MGWGEMVSMEVIARICLIKLTTSGCLVYMNLWSRRMAVVDWSGPLWAQKRLSLFQNLTVGEADEDVEILAMDADLIDEFLEKQKDLKKTTKKSKSIS